MPTIDKIGLPGEGADGWLRVLGKGRQEAVVPVHPELRRLIVRWRTAATDPVWMFPGRYPDSPMSVATATKWTRIILDDAGLPHATGHMARHSYGTRLVEQGTDLPTVMDALRHASLGSSMIYTRSRPVRVREAVARLDY